jgi:hypothetical protein
MTGPSYWWLIIFSGLTALSTVVNTWIHWKTLVWRREAAPLRPKKLRKMKADND